MNTLFLSLLHFNAQFDLRFTLLSNQGPFELRLYEKMVCAVVNLRANFEDSFSKGVKHLEDYIAGSNLNVDRIHHSGPFFQVQQTDGWKVGIILPPTFTSSSNAPMPISRVIKIEDIPSGRVGVLRFKGALSDEIIKRKAQELTRWLYLKGLVPAGAPKIIRNKVHIDLPFLRNNQVLLDVM